MQGFLQGDPRLRRHEKRDAATAVRSARGRYRDCRRLILRLNPLGAGLPFVM